MENKFVHVRAYKYGETFDDFLGCRADVPYGFWIVLGLCGDEEDYSLPAGVFTY